MISETNNQPHNSGSQGEPRKRRVFLSDDLVKETNRDQHERPRRIYPNSSRTLKPRNEDRVNHARPAVRQETRPRRHDSATQQRMPEEEREGLRREGKRNDIIPPLAPGNIRIITLGGVEEIGRNMTAIEFNDDIIVIDAGIQFQEEDVPGIDYILPNTKYLEDRKSKIRAVIITHGHLDHIGGIPYLMDRIGNPPIYSRRLTTIMIQKRQEEFTHMPALDIRIVEQNEKIKVGALTVRFFAVSHTIPDSMGVIIETPYGLIVNPGDIKLDHIDEVPSEREQKEYGQFTKDKVLLLLNDSTNSEEPGWSIPEWKVHVALENIVREASGRLIMGMFASQLDRMLKIVELAGKYGKKIVVEGRSMKTNIAVADQLNMIKSGKENIIPVEQMENYPLDKIIVLATGAQGDEFAALMRMANKSHKYIRIHPGDTIVLSASIVPGNERPVQSLKDHLSRQGAIILHYRGTEMDIHATGHGNIGELEWVDRKVNPRFFIPIHGYHYMLQVHDNLLNKFVMPT